MSPTAIILVQALGAIAAVLAAWLLGRRVLGFRWASIGWGALAFPLSQVARLALVIPLNMGLAQVLEPAAAVAATTAVMLVSSGLFEETTRWIVMRRWATGLREWRDGVGFGLGHGGIEAMLLLTNAAVSNLSLLMLGDVILAQTAGDTEAQAAIEQQIEAVQGITLTMVGMSWYERSLAIIFHVAMSVLVLKGVRERRWQLWLLAVVAHICFNALTVVLAPGGFVAVYAGLTAGVAVALWAVAAGPLSRKQFNA